MNEKSAFVQLGFVRGAHGLRGQLIVHMFSGERGSVTAYGPLCSADGQKTYMLQVTGEKQGDFLCKMEGVTDRNQADDLKGIKLYVPAAALPEPDEDDFYIKDLIDLDVFDGNGILLGNVLNVTHLGQHDALDIRFIHDGAAPLATPQNEYILFTRDAVPVVDVKGGRIVVNLPDRLFQPADAE